MRASSPPPGRSILITSAPRSASICADKGPASTRVRSRILMPVSGRADMAVPPKLCLRTRERPLRSGASQYTIFAGRVLHRRHEAIRGPPRGGLRAGQRAEIVAKLESSKNCRYFETQVEARDVLGLKVDTNDIHDAMQCHRDQDALRDGGEMRASFSLPRYLAVNGTVALAGAFVFLGLATALPALARRYRRDAAT